MVRAELKRAREGAGQCLRLAQNTHNLSFRVRAHCQLGEILSWSGEFVLAREHWEEALALYDPKRHGTSGVLEDIQVDCLSYAALALWCLGYPDQALQRSEEAVILAQKLAHPYSLASSLNYAAMLCHLRREGYAAQERAEAEIVLATEQGFPHWLATGTIWRGWAITEQGREREGILQIRHGLAVRRAMGAEGRRPWVVALLAMAYGKVGQAEEGLAALAEALAVVDKTGERFYEAELYRLKGELTLQQFNVQGSKFKVKNLHSAFHNPQLEAEACFLHAIDIARHQQAKMWELRATASLARLWQQQGKRSEAHRMLSEIYNWFTEGFDTKDLKGAKALLERLESGV